MSGRGPRPSITSLHHGRNWTLAARLLFAAALLFSASAAHAKEHPVPLDKNTDSATCVGCHEDKTKGKAVHSAIAAGCTSCHEVRVSKDTTRVKLITTTPQALPSSGEQTKQP